MLYKICFEQSWKLLKEVLAAHGYEESAAGSPKMILKTAYRAGMIKDEALWLAALNTRNNVSHAYNQAIALEIVRSSKREFYEMFRQLKEESERWLEIQQS